MSDHAGPPERITNSHLSWWRLLDIAYGGYTQAIEALDFLPWGWAACPGADRFARTGSPAVTLIVPARTLSEVPLETRLEALESWQAYRRADRVHWGERSKARPVELSGPEGLAIWRGELLLLHPYDNNGTSRRACDWATHPNGTFANEYDDAVDAQVRKELPSENLRRAQKSVTGTWRWAKSRPSCPTCMTLEDAALEHRGRSEGATSPLKSRRTSRKKTKQGTLGLL